jgi:phage repressor protein C with HTH and peptisase S24 domain
MKTIAERLKHAREAKDWKQVQLATAAGVSPGTIGNIEAGTRQSKGSLPQIAEALGISHKWLATGKGEMHQLPTEKQLIDLDNNPDFPAIRRARIKAQAGVTGYAVEYMSEDDGPPIVFRKDWFDMNGYHPDKMLALRVSGVSMVPSLQPEDLIVVNTEQTNPKDGVAFVVAYEGEIVVKRLVRDAGQWWLSSDNPDQRRYPRKVCDDSTQLVGEVVYRQTEHI